MSPKILIEGAIRTQINLSTVALDFFDVLCYCFSFSRSLFEKFDGRNTFDLTQIIK